MIRRTAQLGTRRGFTLIELLVVVGVVGLLLASLTVAGSTAIYAARAKNTRQVIAGVEFALDVFREENPLRLTYDLPGAATFGAFPPYQLADPSGSGTSVASFVEPDADRWDRGNRNLLSDRLHADMGESSHRKQRWVRFGSDRGGTQANEGDGNDDNRSLVAYLDLYTPGALNGLPDWARKPINPAAPDLINPTGTTAEPGEEGSGWRDVLGIHDAWGVPLDYFQYVRIEWAYDRTGPPNFEFDASYFVRERRPAVRSLGMDRETYDAWRANPSLPYNRRDNWILSSSLPRPWFPESGNGSIDASTGELSEPGGAGTFPLNGWVRAAAANEAAQFAEREDYGYLPTVDPR